MLFLLLLFITTAWPAQRDFYSAWRWTHFGTESGLPPGHITSIIDDSSGTPWVAVENHLLWFDGFRWIAADESIGFPSGEVIFSIYPFDSGKVFVHCNNSVYIGNRARFVRLLSSVHDAVPLGNGRIFVHTDTTMYIYDHGVRTPFPAPKGMELLDAGHDLMATRSGTVWMWNRKALYRLRDGRWEQFFRGNGSGFYVNMLTDNMRGSGCVSLVNPISLRGLWEWSDFRAPVFNPIEQGDWMRALDIAEDDDAYGVYGSAEILERHHGVWSPIYPVPPQMKRVEYLRFRSNGDLWVTGDDGLYLYYAGPSRWAYLRQPAPSKNRVLEIVRSADGSLWMGTADGVERVRPDGRVQLISTILGKHISHITGLAEGADGSIWISSGSSFEGAYRWDGAAWHYFSFPANGLSQFFHKIRRDLHGGLWFLAIRRNPADPGGGAWRLHGGTTQHYGLENGLLSLCCYAFGESEDSAYWFGTEKGLSRLKSGQWTYWKSRIDLPLGKVFTLAIDRNGIVWAADADVGVCRIDSSGGLRFFSTIDGLIDKAVWDIAVDSTNAVWMATQRGLACLNRGFWLQYGERSGLGSMWLWPVLPLEGKVYAGTSGSGLAILDLERCRQLLPRLIADSAIVDNDRVVVHWHVFEYWGAPAPDQALTRYRLDGGDWSAWNVQHQWERTHLPVGRHILEVQAKNFYGMFDPAPAVVCRFEVLPPPFRRPIVVLPMAVLAELLFVLMVVYWLRRRKYQQQLRSLALEVSRTEDRERQTMAAFLHDNVSQALWLCKMKFGLLGSDRQRPGILEIEETIDQIYKDIRALMFDMSPPVLHELGLEDALEWLARDMQRKYKMRFGIRCNGDPADLSTELRSFLYQAIRELMMNAVKHSHGAAVVVTLRQERTNIMVSVADDGKGCTDKKMRHIMKAGKFGIFNIRERLRYLKGDLTMESSPGKGTTVTLRVPIDIQLEQQQD